MEDQLCCVVLPEEMAVTVNGIPVTLLEDVIVQAHPANVPYLFGVDAPKAAPPDDGPDCCGGEPVFGSPAPMTSWSVDFAHSRSEGPFRAILVRRLVARTGASDTDVQNALDQIEADTGRPLLDWLRSGGFQQILEAVLAVLKLFG